MITKKAKAEDIKAERTARIRRALQSAGVNAWRDGMSFQASLDVVGLAWRQMQELADDRAEAEAEDDDEADEEDDTAATQVDRNGFSPGSVSVGEQIDIEGIAAEVTAEVLRSAGQS